MRNANAVVTSRMPARDRLIAEVAAHARSETLSSFAARAIRELARETIQASSRQQTEETADED